MADTDDDQAPAAPGTPGIRFTGPRPLGGLADLAELLGGDSPRSRKFIGGLVVGGLVGAALAGTAVLRRRHHDDAGGVT